ncbi:MAG TPA: T9SS type A sorting domain-containing protein [Bacteroidia bacterium]|jgi:photosystem II stability/assembly factor-like uncharacterized protein|nr:T9SS type A sorting domain-containing protein [Bacteroidia bacterium]
MKKLNLVLSFLFLIYFQILNAQIGGSWKLVGPVLFPVNDVGQINGIGRIEQIKFDPVNPQKVYATSSGGGLFVSTDGTTTWKSTGTDSVSAFAQAGNVAASVCIDYTNTNILYLGTGDANYYSRGFGIWKSLDGGDTWAGSSTGVGNRLAVEILMSPNDHNTLIAATDDGIWKTTNAGATWIEKHTGGDFTDMQFKPCSTTHTIYASTSSTFWVSDDVGETWTGISLPVPTPALQNGGRIGVSKADSSIVYLTYVGDDSANCTPILKSVNSGHAFTVIKPANTCDLNGYDSASLGGYYQGNYNFCLAVDPTNINTLYIGAEMIWKSTDGGVHWTANYHWWEGIHPDMHYFAFSPTNPSILYNANDGGVWQTPDGSATWYPTSDGLSTSECYHATNSPIYKDFICAGLQDNGGVFLNQAEPWQTFQAGDQTDTWAADYTDSTTFYDLGGGLRQQLANSSNNLGFPVSPGNYDLIDFPPLQVNTAYLADSNIYLTSSLFSNPPVWNSILSLNTPVIALASDPGNANVVYAVTKAGKCWYSANAQAATPTWTSSNAPASVVNGACIAPVKSTAGVVYMSCGNKVYRSANNGTSWTNVTANLPAVNIINLYADVYSGTEAIYAATADAVWYKDNTLTNWLNYSKGLPSTCNITNMMLFNDNTNNSRIRVSFYGRGVWESPLNRVINAGIASETITNAMKVYPNPGEGKFNVWMGTALNGSSTLQVFNTLGQLMYEEKDLSFQTGKVKELDLTYFPSGVYFVRLSNADRAGVVKVIKE